MPKSSLEELRGKIAAGDYAIDSGGVAAEMLAKFALVRRVRALFTEETETGGDADGGRGPARGSRMRGRLPQRPWARPNAARKQPPR